MVTNLASSRRGFFRKFSSSAAVASSCGGVVICSSRPCSDFPLPDQPSKSAMLSLTFTSDAVSFQRYAFMSLISPQLVLYIMLRRVRPPGCFWHVQTEFVEAEQRILSRPDDQLTSCAGYAGGTSSIDGEVCYHNAANIADYGSLGHAEVVSLRIPSRSFEDFAVEYCKLFDDKGLRPDQFGDRGGEYRNLVGVPGGKDSIYAKLLVEASVKAGDKLDFAMGKGPLKLSLMLGFLSHIMPLEFQKLFFTLRSLKFHDGFKWGEDYRKSYNSLAAKFAKTEDFGKCPNGLIGIGIGGL